MISSDDLTQEHDGTAFGASAEVTACSAVIQTGGLHLSDVADALDRASR